MMNDYEPWSTGAAFFCFLARPDTHFSALTYRSPKFYSKRKYLIHSKSVRNQHINFSCPVYRLSNSRIMPTMLACATWSDKSNSI